MFVFVHTINGDKLVHHNTPRKSQIWLLRLVTSKYNSKPSQQPKRFTSRREGAAMSTLFFFKKKKQKKKKKKKT